MSEEKIIYNLLLEVRKSVSYIQKRKKQGINHSVVTSSDVISQIRDVMNDLGLILEPHIVQKNVSHEEFGTSSKGNRMFTYIVSFDMEMVWINANNRGDEVRIPWYAVADATNSSYAFGQALTYAEKYFILKYFNIATDDEDPDLHQQKLLEKIPAEKHKIKALKKVIEEIQKLTNESYDSIKEKALITNNINVEKELDVFNAGEYGKVANTLAQWKNAYEKRAKKANKIAED